MTTAADNRWWDNPLISRYASPEMAELWGRQRKYSTWRRLWLALAEAQHELGLLAADGKSPRILPHQLAAMRRCLDAIDFDRADAYERRYRHEVMAHIQAFGDACPEARDIIHLGATSCYVTDNADLVLMRLGLQLLAEKLAGIIDVLAEFAVTWRSTATLGFTHFQPAQLTTVGKRAALWCSDLVLDLREIERRWDCLPFRGVKGATGTQASFLRLFCHDHEKVRELDRRVAAKMGFNGRLATITGQTYSRKLDSQVLDALSGLGQSAHKFGSDLRLLQHRGELEEPMEAEQVGSTAMAYKRNPMRAERLCGLARYLINLSANAAQTAANQWLERTLDDSVNRRLVLPQAFLAADGVLRLYRNIAADLIVRPAAIAAGVASALPFIASEDILMMGVRSGGDRQELHERIRVHSRAAAERLAAGGTNDLLERLRSDPAFAAAGVPAELHAEDFVGRAPEQVLEFVAEEVEPVRRRYPRRPAGDADIAV